MKRIRPHLKSFRLSFRSPQVPAGNMNRAVPRMKEVMIQLNSMAVRERFRSMVGNAMFTAEIRKVPMKEVVDTTSNTESSSLFPILVV